MNDNWYVYVSKETLQVTKVSPVLEEDDAHIIQIEKDVGLSFIDGPHLINEYVIYFDGTKAHFIKKEKSKDVVVPFYYSPLMIDSKVKDPDILVTIKKNKMTIALKPELKAYAMTIYGNVDKTKQSVEFYVSKKNDPNGLLEIFHVDMMELITKGVVTFEFDYEARNISIFTRKIFDSYGLKK